MSGPREDGEPREEPDIVVMPGVPNRSPRGVNPIAIFAGALLLTAVTFGSSLGLLMRGTTLSSAESSPPATAARTATATPTPVRVTAGTASAERLDSGAYRVTFSWTLEGAREGDTALLRFSVGSRVISEQRGTLDANIFSSATGRFIITTSQDCSVEGWSAELVSLRGVAPVGETTSRAAGVTCG